jgi:2-iminobutanoate/2-iminopropanoate deaminase
MRQQSLTIPGLEHPGAPSACRIGPIVASSAILGRDPETGEMPEDIESQSRYAFTNMKRLLAAFGLDEGDVVKLTMFVKDKADREVVRNHWYECYPNEAYRPARHTLVVPINVGRVQLEILAVVRDS